MKTCGNVLLQTKRLAIEVANPGTVYTGSRFDWSGFITQVTLDGRHTFCMPEDTIPGLGAGGIGLCNEFGLNTPIGYYEAPAGGNFFKIGVGTLKKRKTEPDSPMRGYEIVDFCNITHEQTGEASMRFLSVNPAFDGYACRLEKTLTASDNTLTVAYRLENTGEKELITEEYIHNFVGIDGIPIGPNYHLSLAFTPEIKEQSVFTANGQTLSWAFTPKHAFYTKSSDIRCEDGVHWNLLETTTGCTMEEHDSFRAKLMAVWGVGHVVSAEAFYDVRLKPGESAEWSRTFIFN